MRRPYVLAEDLHIAFHTARLTIASIGRLDSLIRVQPERTDATIPRIMHLHSIPSVKNRGRLALTIRPALRLVISAAAVLMAAGSVARAPTNADLDARALDAAAREYRALAVSLNGRTGIAERRRLHDRAAVVETVAVTRTADLQVQLRRLQAELAAVKSATPGQPRPEHARVRQRQIERAAVPILDAVRSGDQLARDTRQLLQETASSPAEDLVEQLSVRSASPMSRSFWESVAAAAPRDARRMGLLWAVELDTLEVAPFANLWSFVLCFAAAVGLMIPLRLWLRGLGRRIMIDRAPADRLRKSGRAAWTVAGGALIPTAAASIAIAGAKGSGLLAAAWNPLIEAFVRASTIAGLICGLGAALLIRSDTAWRLFPVSTDAAKALRPWTWAAATLIFITVLVDACRQAAGLSAAARGVEDVLISASHAALAAALLIRIGRLRLSAIAKGDAVDDGAGETSTALASIVAWAATLTALGCLVLGYVNLSLLLARMLLWLPLVIATLVVALVLSDDVSTQLISSRSAFGRGLHRGFSIRASLIDQGGVFVSALVRLALLVLAASVALGPFGSNLDTLWERFVRLSRGATIGGVTISPGAVLQSLMVLAGGLLVVRVVQHWLTRRYLPATDLDAGARNSVVMVTRYAGLILACLWALASLGIGVERIALLLSALSVGIGFGLQAITQNFVSGLILLAERPVKIGDLVRIGDQEGDVRRISVRATEIQVADQSTLIVPNSELITKTIRNMTLANPMGRVQLRFSVPLGADVSRIRDMLTTMFEAAAAVLDDPPPRIFVDSIVDGRVNMNSFAYVASQRDVYTVRSDLLFRLLEEFPKAGIDLGSGPQLMQLITANDSGGDGAPGHSAAPHG